MWHGFQTSFVMQKEIYSLEHIRHTQFATWTDFFESLEKEEPEAPSAVVRYRSKDGELKEIELPFRKEDIQFLAYYEALDEIKSMGLNSFHELVQQMEKRPKNGQKDYQHYYVTRGENRTIEMHSVLVPVERIARFAEVEKQELMKFAEPPNAGTRTFN